ncbi:MAG: SDR family NAD(P)-dependent oxidoreductase [Gammaproteobacteria bacterium]|nr:SDR family NAD(P)-dependent oxidoreductase [Gammaproteobacteria bacterium]
MPVNRRDFVQFAGAALVTPMVSSCGPDRRPAPGVPRSEFDGGSTAEEVTAGVDLDGKLAVVTGCTSGIGFETMRVLAKRGAYVVGTGRTLEKAQEACLRVDGVTTPLQLELSDFDSVVACADTINAMRTPIDILVCNAGMRGQERELVYGLEKHFVVNHLGHFILVYRLLERMYLAWQGRVVVVGSRAAYRSAPQDGIQFDDLQAAGGYSVSRAYAHSKLANALFSLELAKLLKGTRITSNALHPGVIDTRIARNESGLRRTAFSLYTRLAGKSVEQGAATSCYVATSPLLGSTSGRFFEDCNAVQISGDHHLYDAAMAERLWAVSEELVREYLVELKRPTWEDLGQQISRPKPRQD